MQRIATLAVFAAVLAAFTAVNLPLAAADKDEKWVQLFNGKDLTGWKTLPEDKAKWEVKDGMIVGSGGVGHLYSERGDYENFRYRVTAKINDKGNSGQYFRTKMQKGFPPGYEAQINATHGDPVKTGSLYNFAKNLEAPNKPDEFFTQEVIADGNHIIIKVNGKVITDFTDPKNTYTKGHFAIQQHDPGSVITIKSIEVIELPPTK
jgi:hypothetical protein